MDKYKKRLKVMSKLEKLLVAALVFLVIWILALTVSNSSLNSNVESITSELAEANSQIIELNDEIAINQTAINNLKNPDITESVTIEATEDKYEDVKDGEDTTLGYGTFEVGVDIEPGTYSLTPVAGYDNLFVRGILGGTSYSHTFGFNQFDESAARTVKNISLVEGETIEVDDVEVEFKANSSEELVSEGSPESIETMTRTYNNNGKVVYQCTKDDESIDCEQLEEYNSLKTKVDKQAN